MRFSPLRTRLGVITLMLALGSTSSALAQAPATQTDLKLQASDDERPPSAPRRADEDYARFAAFLQVGGSAMALGLGLDARPLPLLALRAGLATLPIPSVYFGAGGFLGASGVFGRSAHKFEVGFDYIRFIDDEELRFYSPLAGYRYQPERSGTFVRVNAQALLRVRYEVDVFPTAGLSIGYTQ